MTSFQGEIGLDLFGEILMANYRICSEDTVIVNRVLDRDAAPGSATFWLLTRYLGFATANHILMEGKSLTALQLAAEGAATPIDIGKVNDRIFVNVTCGGFGAEVTASKVQSYEDFSFERGKALTSQAMTTAT
jgi:hypothetical protein